MSLSVDELGDPGQHLTPAQRAAVRLLADHDPVEVGSATTAVGYPTTVHRTPFNKLVVYGLAEYVTPTSWRVRLTDKGKALAEAMRG